MKLHLLKRGSLEDHSFNIKKNSYPFFLKIWHHHIEFELILILKSTGTRFIGDSIEKFNQGEVVLIGGNLPHMWLNDDPYFDDSSNLIAEAIGIHFKRDFLGPDFFRAPEMIQISNLLDRAKQGIKFIDLDRKTINTFKKIVKLRSFKKTLKFIELLFKLSKHDKYQLLSSEGFISSFNSTQSKNLGNVYEYIFENFKNPIYLSDVANIAHMNPSAFSRLFKQVNRKTFSKYLNDVRVGYACKLLLEQKYNISRICYESGFNNISNFNKQFKEIKKVSPSDYIQKYSKI